MTYSNFGHENSDAGRIKWSRGPQVPACFKRTVWIQIWCQRSRRISLRMFTFLPASVKTVIFQITILVFLSSVWLFLALCFFAVTCCVAVLFSIFRARKSILFCFLIQKKRFPCYHFSSNFGARQFAVTRLREWVDPVISFAGSSNGKPRVEDGGVWSRRGLLRNVTNHHRKSN